MANPSIKSQGMNEFLDSLTGRSTAINNGTCVNPPYGCGKPATNFRDKTSENEFTISGLCQRCQDYVFMYDNEHDHLNAFGRDLTEY